MAAVGQKGFLRRNLPEGFKTCRAGCAEARWWGCGARPDTHLPANLSFSSEDWEISWVLTQEVCPRRGGSPELLAGCGLLFIHHREKLKPKDRRSRHIQQSLSLLSLQSPNLKKGRVELNALEVPSSSDLLSVMHPSLLSLPQIPISAECIPDM